MEPDRSLRVSASGGETGGRWVLMVNRQIRVRKQEIRDKIKGQIIKGLLVKLRSWILMTNRKFHTE